MMEASAGAHEGGASSVWGAVGEPDASELCRMLGSEVL